MSAAKKSNGGQIDIYKASLLSYLSLSDTQPSHLRNFQLSASPVHDVPHRLLNRLEVSRLRKRTATSCPWYSCAQKSWRHLPLYSHPLPPSTHLAPGCRRSLCGASRDHFALPLLRPYPHRAYRTPVSSLFIGHSQLSVLSCPSDAQPPPQPFTPFHSACSNFWIRRPSPRNCTLFYESCQDTLYLYPCVKIYLQVFQIQAHF